MKIKTNLLNIARKTFIRKGFLSMFISLNNFSYKWAKVFASDGENHPKHKILNYDQFYIENVAPGDVVIDVGCSNGHLSNSVSSKAKKVVGIDISKKNIETARKKNKNDNIEYILGDATEYEFNEKFDVILLSNVLEHIENRVVFLEKLHKLSDKIILRVPMVDRDWFTIYKKENGFEYRLDDTHFIEYTIDILNNELKESGWRLDNYSVQFGELWGVVNNL